MYDGSLDSLYYAFDGVIGKYSTEVYDVTDGNHIYRYENEEEGEGSLIDTISYTTYIAPREEGKGVIYRLIDEHNNDCPFDFKNMQFLHNGEWYYTFSYYGTDASLGDKCNSNYLELVQNQDSEQEMLPPTMPMLVFNLIDRSDNDTKAKGIFSNNVRTYIRKGFIQSFRIDGNMWTPHSGGRAGDFDEVSIYSTMQIYGNTFYGHARKFVAGTIDNPIGNFYGNILKLPILRQSDVVISCSRFAGSTLDIHNSGSKSKIIKGGDILNCYFDDFGATSEVGDVNVVFTANLAMANCYIRLFDSLNINYDNTTSSTSPLRFLNIDARGWSRGTSITIPSGFKPNAEYELKVAKNSKGEIKMWCDADLIA